MTTASSNGSPIAKRGPGIAGILREAAPETVYPAVSQAAPVSDFGLKDALAAASRGPPPPGSPWLTPEMLQQSVEATQDFFKGLFEGQPGDRLNSGAENAASGQLKGAATGAMADKMIPGRGPMARVSRAFLSTGLGMAFGDGASDAPAWPARGGKAGPPETAAQRRDRYLNAWSDPYLYVEQKALSEGRAATEKERREFERYPEALQASLKRNARADFSRGQAEAAYRAAQRRGADPLQDSDYLFWDDRRAHDLRAVYDALKTRR